MKKLLLATLFATGITVAQAQTTATPAPQSMTKAEKDAAKAKKQAQLQEAFDKAGLSAPEQMKCRDVFESINLQTKPIKVDASLTDDEKKARLDELYKVRNENLKAVMGEERYKLFKAAQKAQKEASGQAG